MALPSLSWDEARARRRGGPDERTAPSSIAVAGLESLPALATDEGEAMPDSTQVRQRDGAARTAISDGMVALLKEYYGVGPTQTKTYYHDDLVVCLMRGGFTRVEQTLLEGGRTSAVIQQRMEFQEVMRARFTGVIEQATGRRVVGFMSGNQQSPDMICEVFVLEPTDLLRNEEP
jgi:uncharacterized protein YbcI